MTSISSREVASLYAGGGGCWKGGRRTHRLPVYAVQPQATSNTQLEVYGGDVTPLASATHLNGLNDENGFWHRCVGGKGVLRGCMCLCP